MTTQFTIKNHDNSNGDMNIIRPDQPTVTLFPGQEHVGWMSSSQGIFITETWPSKKPKPEVVPVPLIQPSQK